MMGPLLLLIVAVYLGLAILGSHAWVLRLCAEIFLETAIIVTLAYAGLSPRYTIVKGGKLASNTRTRERAQVERLGKAFFVFCAILIFFALLVPLLRGTLALSRGRPPEIITGEVMTTSTWMGTWFLNQNIQVRGQNKSLHYSFSVERPVKTGETYRLTVLPGTQVVLNAQPDSEPTKGR